MFDPLTLRGAFQNVLGGFLVACGAVVGINVIGWIGRAIAAATN